MWQTHIVLYFLSYYIYFFFYLVFFANHLSAILWVRNHYSLLGVQKNHLNPQHGYMVLDIYHLFSISYLLLTANFFSFVLFLFKNHREVITGGVHLLHLYTFMKFGLCYLLLIRQDQSCVILFSNLLKPKHTANLNFVKPNHTIVQKHRCIIAQQRKTTKKRSFSIDNYFNHYHHLAYSTEAGMIKLLRDRRELDQTIAFREIFSAKKLAILKKRLYTKGEHLQQDLGKEEEWLKKAKRMVKTYAKYTEGKDQVLINYKFSQFDSYRQGRRYCVGTSSLQAFPRQLRSYIARDLYYDIDMNNCHPRILLNICKALRIQSPHLQEYVTHREKLIKEQCKKNTNMNRSEVKQLYLKITNCSKHWWKNMGPKTKHIIEYSKEIKTITESLILKLPIKYAYTAKQKRERKNKGGNTEGSFIATLNNIIENKIVQIVINYFTSVGGIKNGIAVPCFDGIMIPKRNFKNKDEVHMHIQTINSKILQALGLEMEFKLKDFDNDISNLFQEYETKGYFATHIVPSIDELECYCKDKNHKAKIVILKYKGKYISYSDMQDKALTLQEQIKKHFETFKPALIYKDIKIWIYKKKNLAIHIPFSNFYTWQIKKAIINFQNTQPPHTWYWSIGQDCTGALDENLTPLKEDQNNPPREEPESNRNRQIPQTTQNQSEHPIAVEEEEESQEHQTQHNCNNCSSPNPPPTYEQRDMRTIIRRCKRLQKNCRPSMNKQEISIKNKHRMLVKNIPETMWEEKLFNLLQALKRPAQIDHIYFYRTRYNNEERTGSAVIEGINKAALTSLMKQCKKEGLINNYEIIRNHKKHADTHKLLDKGMKNRKALIIGDSTLDSCSEIEKNILAINNRHVEHVVKYKRNQIWRFEITFETAKANKHFRAKWLKAKKEKTIDKKLNIYSYKEGYNKIYYKKQADTQQRHLQRHLRNIISTMPITVIQKQYLNQALDHITPDILATELDDTPQHAFRFMRIYNILKQTKSTMTMHTIEPNDSYMENLKLFSHNIGGNAENKLKPFTKLWMDIQLKKPHIIVLQELQKKRLTMKTAQNTMKIKGYQLIHVTAAKQLTTSNGKGRPSGGVAMYVHQRVFNTHTFNIDYSCLLYTSPSPRDRG